MFKGVVFDLDGTLVDSPLCFKSIRKKLEIPEDELILEYLAKQPAQLQRKKLVELEEIELAAAEKATLFPGVLELMTELQNLKIHTAIFTRNCRRATDRVVNAFKLPVCKVVTREDAPPKPDPTAVVMLLKTWKVSPNDLLYVGDFRFDIECGKSAGVRTALFTNGQEPREHWNADYIIPNYHEFWGSLRQAGNFELPLPVASQIL